MKYTLLFILLLRLYVPAQSQSNALEGFGDLSGPERWWVVSHLFTAQKAYEIGKEARKMTREVQADGLLRGDGNGGQIDAFRHSYWMARLTQEIGAKRAEKLGIAHEKGNKKDFEKGELEEGFVPDKASVSMDLKNNVVGIELGKRHPHLGKEDLKRILTEKILNGDLYILRQDNKGRYLDRNNEIIPQSEWEGSWENERNLVPSDYKVKVKKIPK